MMVCSFLKCQRWYPNMFPELNTALEQFFERHFAHLGRQVENSETSETSEISEIFFRLFLFRLFDFGLILNIENSEEENPDNKFRRFRRFRCFRVFSVQIDWIFSRFMGFFCFLFLLCLNLLFLFCFRLLDCGYPTCKSMFKVARTKSNVYYICSKLKKLTKLISVTGRSCLI